MNIITEFPIGYAFFCLLAGIAYAAVLYFRDYTFHELSNRIKLLMASFRFLVVMLISFLLLSPYIKTVLRRTEKPIVVIAQDNSASLLAGGDSAFMKNTLPEKLEALAKKLEDKFDVQRFSYGEKAQDLHSLSELNFKEKQTDMSALFEEINNRYSNRNLGAVIVAGDGLFNHGANPIYSAEKIKIPIYTIALGDTGMQRDLSIQRINCNKTAFLGNDFPVEVIIAASKCAGESTQLTLTEDSTVLISKKISISSDNFHYQEHLSLDAKSKGIHHYKVSLSAVKDEATTQNNSRDLFVEVLENKQKILILADAPHPDLTAIKQAIEESSHYELKIAYTAKFDGNVNPYDLVILYQLPSLTNNLSSIASKLIQSKMPLWFILGGQSSIQNFNSLSPGVNITTNISRLNDVTPVLRPDFALFTVSAETQKKLSRFPPLQSVFGTYKTSVSSAVLLEQQSGQVKTTNPLLSFLSTADTRIAVLAGEGLWRWNLSDFSENGNHEAFYEIILKTVQFLSVKEDKKPFRVMHKNNFEENEALLFDAELHNESYELVNTADVHLVISNKEGKKFPFTFSKTDRAYTLNAGSFPPGNYKYEASVKTGEKTLIINGSFSITALQIEFSGMPADYGLLYLLANKHEGSMADKNSIEQLADRISAREDVKAVSYSENKLSELINLKWVFALFLLLLSAEWFFRKRNGGY